MKLSTVTLNGYRNFKDAIINLNDKTLIIGANDVGKTNLFWAIRLLLDRGLSDYDIEPSDSDFYAFEETNEFSILLRFEDVTEECVVSKLRGKVSDDDVLFLCYKGYRNKLTGAKSYQIFVGPSEDGLEETEERNYRKVLNVKYISSRRDFHNYINREKNFLFQSAKENREEAEITADEKLYEQIQAELRSVDEKIPKLNFISSATKTINRELLKLSLHHAKQTVVFDGATSNVENFIKSVSIASKSNGQNVIIGGDGRLNQIYLALWASRNELTDESIKEVTIFCIEEPEAHLHPHQQRKLADYLQESLSGQVLISSHSPQIASEFSPNSIVRLLSEENSTYAASDGCSEIIADAINDFGYRMSIIPAEAFFADVVLLVEGPSEELFYKTLSKQIGIDLDRLNISILVVTGVGFQTTIDILSSLKIYWVARTDNDISKIPKKEIYWYAGIMRGVRMYERYCTENDEMNQILEDHKANLKGFLNNSPEQENMESANIIKTALENFDIYISDIDLENDLYNSEIREDLETFFKIKGNEGVVSKMKERKATFMYDFLKQNKTALAKLHSSKIAVPLISCKVMAEEIQDETN